MGMCRALDILPTNVDPIPDDIVKDFNLLDLYDVSCSNIPTLLFERLVCEKAYE